MSRFVFVPQDAHAQTSRRILRYIQRTKDYGIFFPRNGPEELVQFSDADRARDLDKQRSTMGLIYKFHGFPIFWSSRLQPTVAISTTKVEYRALTDGA
jgi:hypothetical protein